MGASCEFPKDGENERILQGFKINCMNMRNAYTGEMMWDEKWPDNWKTEEITARIPKAIMNCRAVSRELNFSSKEEIRDLWMIQQVFLGETRLEEWVFQFGFVIPGSTNSWQSTIEAVAEKDMLNPDAISGLVRIHTSFKNGGEVISSSSVRVYYV